MLYTVQLHLIEDIHSKMKTLLSESNYQQQDLNTIKDDLGALKFGLAYVQHTTTELCHPVVVWIYADVEDLYSKINKKNTILVMYIQYHNSTI